MTTGAYISGGAHLVLIAILLFGGLFSRDQFDEVEVSEVSLISEAELAALFPPTEGPEIDADAASLPIPETELEPLPENTPQTDLAPQQVQPELAEASEPPSELPQTPELIVPDAEVTSEAPVVAPPSFSDGPTIVPDAAPAPAPRVASVPTPAPPPEVETAPDISESVAPIPDEAAEDVVEEIAEAAPEAATTEIVTEAEEEEVIAPTASVRPRSRPPRPVETAEPTETEQEEPAVVADRPVETPTSPPRAPSGPPLNFGEREALRVAVGSCWSVDVGSRSADVVVTVGVTMTREGRVEGNLVRQISAEGGDDAAQRAAFEKARRAILRCQQSGFPLPPEKYDHWREIEMVFNPEGMRLR